ncbi:hypothetical protein [Streptomyces botrytidirepellens]|uniref:Uncharacterized protein n=1 Tax=Streptomyces botrytidirepellens TaxID=2486417 RepID=A0A3M8WRI3_9ACTN|nr:hypothetical protein [Streptomyces botrytidirepellens]RNG31351.1 hypothetical protein EEJ42_08880 [Streptomyces botrytidirepellens]
MGILYRDRSKPAETDEEIWNNPLNSYLREHDMGHAGTSCNLPDMIRHIQAIGSLWWQYTSPAQATLGAIRFISDGIIAPALTPLIEGPELFTAVAVEGLRSWHALLDHDDTRRTAYGDDHADRLLPAFSLGEYLFDQDGARCIFTDGSRRDVPAGTVVAMLVIDRVPIPSDPKDFGGTSYYDRETRVSTVDYFAQIHAVQQGWKKAADAAPSTTA